MQEVEQEKGTGDTASAKPDLKAVQVSGTTVLYTANGDITWTARGKAKYNQEERDLIKAVASGSR